MNITMLNNAMNNLCQQLVNVQQHIATREENPNLPTVKEIAMQVRMINAIDKLQKMVTRVQKEQAKEAAQPPARKYSDPPPFRPATFERYTYLLNEHNTARRDDLVPIEGKDKNLRWMIYNIFQHYLPEEERMYIEDVEVFRNTIHMGEVSHKIATFLKQVQSKAA
jgi:hypothetical protein